MIRRRGTLFRSSVVLLLGGLMATPSLGAEPSLFETAHPFRAVSRWLITSDGAVAGRSTPRFSAIPPSSSEGAVKRALLMLSKTQLMTKGVDGAAFKLSVATRRGAGARSNITSELIKLRAALGAPEAQEGERVAAGDGETPPGGAGATGASGGVKKASSRPTVAAAKLVHKAQTVQRALRAAELVELARLAQQIMMRSSETGEVGDDSSGEAAVQALLRDEGWMSAARAAGVELATAPLNLRVPLRMEDKNCGVEVGSSVSGVEDNGLAGMVCALVLREVIPKGESKANVTAAEEVETLTLVLSDTIQGAALLQSLAPEPVMVCCRHPLVESPPDHAAEAGGAAISGTPPPVQPLRTLRRAAVAPTVLWTAAAVRRSLGRFLAGQKTPRGVPKNPALAKDNATTTTPAGYPAVDGIRRPVRRLECVGHSFSGSVAAVLAALLDGTLVDDIDGRGRALNKTSGDDLPAGSKATKTHRGANLEDSAALSDLVTQCVALGPCPCVGSAVSLPGVTSVVLGDDLFARLQCSSLKRLQERVGRFLVSSPGGKSGVLDASKGAVKLAAKLSTAWVGDALGSTVRNIQHRSAMDAKSKKKKRTRADGAFPGDAQANAAEEGLQGRGASTGVGEQVASRDSSEDGERLLLCPGIVYLLKPRASGDIVVTTTKRGGLGESLLMSMHDVLLSKSMLAHHLLEAYIHALDKI